MPEGAKASLEIRCDGKTWFMTLPVEDGSELEAKWEPGLTCVIRIRQRGTYQPWSFGRETPIPRCTFVDLKPDMECELQLRAKSAAREGAPTHITMRTNPTGGSSNIAPFRDGKDPTPVMHVFGLHHYAPGLPRSWFPPLNLHPPSPFPPLRRLTNS